MKKRFEALDGLRGVCALFVVIFHLHFAGSLSELAFFRNSAIFVEFFFVLSGFVLVHGYASKSNLKFSTFVSTRFFRLYPLHIFMFIIFVFLELIRLSLHKIADISFNKEAFTGSTAISEIIPNILLLQSWLPGSNNLSFNGPSWSISVEFYLYIILFVTIVLCKKFKPLVWLVIMSVTFMLMLSGTEFITPYTNGLVCFFGGAFIYTIYQKLNPLYLTKRVGSILEIILVILTVIVVQSDFNYSRFIAIILFFFVILIFSFEFGLISKLLKSNPFQKMGILSYSIYMTHAAIIACFDGSVLILQKLTNREFLQMVSGVRLVAFGNATLNNFAILVILIIIITISHLTYKHIELKGQALGKRIIQKYE